MDYNSIFKAFENHTFREGTIDQLSDGWEQYIKTVLKKESRPRIKQAGLSRGIHDNFMNLTCLKSEKAAEGVVGERLN